MKKIINKLFILFLLFSGISVFADVPIGNPGDGFNGGDPGSVAPINDYLIPMLLLGVALGYRLVRKKTQKVL
jgi:hypothetical protein